jgi:hypothetical protein
VLHEECDVAFVLDDQNARCLSGGDHATNVLTRDYRGVSRALTVRNTRRSGVR